MQWMRYIGWPLAAVTVGSAAIVIAQDQPAETRVQIQVERDGIDLQSIYGRDNTSSVYVRDSAVAVEKIALAERMERLQEWNKAAELYQEILEQYADRVLPSQTDEENKIYQYASVAKAVQDRLSRWPAAGLGVYRARFEPLAQAMLEGAAFDDLPVLHGVLQQYFPTTTALTAGMRLVDLYLESGDFGGAVWIAQRLIAMHPDVGPHRAALLFRLGAAQHLAGDVAGATATLKTLRDNHANATLTVGGDAISIVDALTTQLEKAPIAASEQASDSWPTPFGSNDRSRVPAGGAKGMVLTASVSIMPTAPRNIPQPQAREFQRQKEGAGSRGMLNGIMPVVDQGAMYFHDNARVYAVSLTSGLPLPGWAATYGGDANGTFHLTDAWSMPANTQMTLTLGEREVVAILGHPDMLATQTMGTPVQSQAQLVSLDRVTGKRLWATSLRSVKLPHALQSLREMQLIGTPLLAGDNIYVQARGGSGRQFEESYLLCFNREDGTFRWATYLASAGTGMQAWGEFGPIQSSAAASHLAYASGRVFALTNLGAVAAIDAFDGTIAWLNIYPKTNDGVNPNARFGGARTTTTAARPFSGNPVIVRDGKVFVLPNDGTHIHVYDAGTGIEFRRLARSHFGNAHTMLGIAGKRMVLAGDQQVWCVDWNLYNLAKYDPNGFDDALLWKTSNITRMNTNINDAVRGRGFVTESTVYIPTVWDLRRYTLASGRLEGTHPTEGQWDGEEVTGNVLSVGEHLIIAGPDRVNVYTDPMVIRARLDRAEAEAPSDPDPRISSAEVMFVAGDRPASLAKIDEAMNLIGGSPLRAGPAQARVFGSSMTFARKLLTDLDSLQPAITRQRIELASQFFERAERAAISAQERAQFLFARATLAEIQKDPATQVQLYQSVLLDPVLSAEQISESGGTTSAAVLAERQIADVLRRAGRAPYAEFDRKAAADFAAAADTEGVDALTQIIARYPNAEVVGDVLAEAAIRLESADRPLEAAQAWRRLLSRAPEPRVRLIAHEAIARNGLLSPTGGDLAIAQLRQALQISNDATLTRPLKLRDGRTIDPGKPLRDVIDLLRAEARALAEAQLPDFNLLVITPQNREEARKVPPFGKLDALPRIEGVRALLPPIATARRLDRVIAWDGKALLIIDTTKGSVAHRVPAPEWFVEEASGSAWQDNRVIAFCRAGLLAINVDDGSITWAKRLSALPAVDELGDNLASLETDDFENDVVNDERAMQLRRVRVRQMVIRQNAVRARAGGEDAIRHVRMLSDSVVINTTQGRLANLALDTGEPRWQFGIGDRNADRLETTPDLTALLVRDELMTNLIVLTNEDGTVRFRRALGRENGVGIANFALSADGTLVYLTADRLVGVELFGDPSRPAFQTDRSANEPNLFMNSTEPDQLILNDGRILAVVFGQQNQQAVRAFSLADGKPLRYRDPKTGNETIARFPLDAAGERISIRAVGNRMYLIGQRSMVSFDLDTGAKQWNRSKLQNRQTSRDVLIGRDYIIAIDETAAGRNVMQRAQLNCFSRRTVESGVESGAYDYATEINLPGGSAYGQWQPVDGGLVIRAGTDLLLLRGQRPTE